MTHSMAHPLSEKYGMHHGLANSLLVAHVVDFLQQADLNEAQKKGLQDVNNLFDNLELEGENLSQRLKNFTSDLGIKPGLKNHGVGQSDLEELAGMALEDPCHATNLIPVEKEDFLKVFNNAF